MVRNPAGRASIVFVALALLAGCGGEEGVGDTSADEADMSQSADPAEDVGLDLGWVIAGPTGSKFEVTETVTREAGDEVISMPYTLDDSGTRQMLYSAFILATEVTVEVVSGGPLTIELVTGTLGDDGASVVVDSVLESAEVSSGESVTVSGDRPGS